MTTDNEGKSNVIGRDTNSKKLGRQGQTELTRLATALDTFVSKTSMSQREIANAVGFKNQNMITMIKQGDAKLPIDRAPAMARVMDVDPMQFFEMTLEQYYTPEAIKDLKSILPPTVTASEREVIDLIREAGKKGKSLTAARLAAIREIFES